MIPTFAKTRSCPSSGRGLFRIRLSIPTLIPAMTSSTFPSPTTTGSTTQTPMFSIGTITSQSRTSGTRPSARSADTTAFRKTTFPSFSRRLNFASTTENPASNCELSNPGPNSSLSQTIWDSPKFFGLAPQLAFPGCGQVYRAPCSLVSGPPSVTRRILAREIYSMIFCYTQGIAPASITHGRNTIRWTGFDPKETFVANNRTSRIDVKRTERTAALDASVGRIAGV
jgi:hypothetical protein